MNFRRTLTSALCVTAVVVADFPAPAQAQWIVFDPTNFGQNVLTAARELQQVNNEILSLQNQARMLINQARNLASLPYSSLAQMEQTINQTRQLLAQAQNIGYDVSTINQAFAQTYPQAYSSATSSRQLLADAHSRWENARASYQDAMRVQAGVVQNLNATGTQVDALVSSSQAATGALQAAQSGNQLLALQSRQLSATQDLIVADARAQAANAMQNAEVQSAAQADWKRFYGSGVSYTPTPVNVFGGPAP